LLERPHHSQTKDLKSWYSQRLRLMFTLNEIVWRTRRQVGSDATKLLPRNTRADEFRKDSTAGLRPDLNQK